MRTRPPTLRAVLTLPGLAARTLLHSPVRHSSAANGCAGARARKGNRTCSVLTASPPACETLGLVGNAHEVFGTCARRVHSTSPYGLALLASAGTKPCAFLLRVDSPLGTLSLNKLPHTCAHIHLKFLRPFLHTHTLSLSINDCADCWHLLRVWQMLGLHPSA